MNPDSPKTPREEMEARLTALLLGELSAEEAAAVRDAIAHDAELARLHERLKQTIGLVRETVASPTDGMSAKPDALKLSTERREKLFQHFKTKPMAARETVAPRWRWQMPWFVPMSAAAVLVLTIGLMLPAFQPAREMARSVTMLPSRIKLMEQIGEPEAAATQHDFDADGAIADESRRKSRWFAGAAKSESTMTIAPPPDLPPSPALPAESKPQSHAIVLPEAGLGTVNVEARFANVAEENVGKQVEFYDRVGAQGGTAPTTIGGLAGGGGGGSGVGGGRGSEWGEKRELAQVERSVEARDNLATSSDSELAPLPLKIPALANKGMPEDLPSNPNIESLAETLRPRTALALEKAKQLVPSTAPVASPPPAVQSIAGAELAYRGEPAVSGPATAANPTPAPARRPVASRASSERSLSEGIAVNGIEPTKTVALAAIVADPVVVEAQKARAAFDTGIPQLGLPFQKSLDEGKKLVPAQKQLADRNGPAGETEIKQLDAIAGKPVAGVGGVERMSRLESRVSDGGGAASLGNTPALGQLYETTRGFFDDNIATPAKPVSGVETRAKNNQTSFGVNVVNGGGEVVRLQGEDSVRANMMVLEDRVADVVATADRSGLAEAGRKDSEAANVNLYFSHQDLAADERAGLQTLARGGDQNPAEWDFLDRFDAKERVSDKKAAVSGQRNYSANTAKGIGFRAGGTHSPNVVGYAIAPSVTNVSVAEPSNWGSNLGASSFGRSQLQEESLVGQRVEIALPKVRSDEGRPVGERAAGRYVASAPNLTKESAKVEDTPALLVAKRDLEAMQFVRERLARKIAQEKVDAATPKSSIVEVIDAAEVPTARNQSVWKRVAGKLTGEVEAAARISVEPAREIASINGERPAGGTWDPYWIQNRFEAIQSKTILYKVIEKLNLDEAWSRKSTGGGKLSREETYQRLKQKLDVRSVPNTDLVEIRVKSDKADEAARIANAIAETYRDVRREHKQAIEAMEARGVQKLEEELGRVDNEIALKKGEGGLGKNETKLQQTDVVAPKPAPTASIPQPEIQSVNNAFSTFSLNVSDVSFKLAAASLEKGAMPDPSTVRSEEFINAFDYRDPEPTGAPIAFAWERARYPFVQNRDLLRLSVKTAAAGRQPGRPLNLVLLLDNSGSMERADRVRIIQQCLRVLAGQLRPEDRISVVTFARTPRLWVDGLAGNQAAQVAEQVGGLTPQGGTNLEEAMNLAYQTALRHYLANGINRVVLLTDGAANLGDLQPESLKKKVESFRKQGIALDCFGIGWEGFNDDLLEVLSRNGDGRYGFVNTPEEAATGFAGQLAGPLKVAASDVKVQVEFNPKRVTSYRQIGYAKHQLTKQQFRDNTVDAAEIAAQEAGNALYTIETNPGGEGPIATVRVRYKIPGTMDYREQAWDVPYAGNAVALEQSSPAMRLAATASAFSEWLASSPFAAEVTPDQLLNYLSGVPEICGADQRPKKLEWMIRQAKSLEGK